jgi:hypothetical protein
MSFGFFHWQHFYRFHRDSIAMISIIDQQERSDVLFFDFNHSNVSDLLFLYAGYLYAVELPILARDGTK